MKDVLNRVSRANKQVMLGLSAVVLAVSAVVTPMVSNAHVAAQAAANVRLEGQVQVANVTTGETDYKDSVNAKVDDVVKVQVWYHNRENFDSNKVAQNLRVGINVPTAQGKNQTVTGTIKADNSNVVTDSAQVNLSLDNAYLEYVSGSAKWRYNKGANDGRKECQTGNKEVPANDPNKCYVTETISDDVTKGEMKIEDAYKPCYAYESTITVLMRVKAKEVKVNKFVSKHDGDNNVKNNDWQVKNEAKPGDKLDYMIRFENKGNVKLEDVVVGDNLPDYVEYVPGSTRIITGNNPNGVAAGTDNVYKGGINVGSYAPGAAGYVVFTAKVNDKKAFDKCGTHTLKNVGVVRPKGMNEFYNTAHTDVKVECQQGQGQGQGQKPQQQLPETLPSTGPAALLSGLFGTSALGLGAHSFIASRRALRAAMKQ
ncbi:hypothetical protein CYG49_04265 [Candidatus Saccharibacteria bacterium]|nr:MAG: hypothetical protein CYG49_04265 [Candidatus Saccharibacteria bacterium]